MRSLILLFIFGSFCCPSFAQSDWCGTDEALHEYLNASPRNRITWEQKQENLRQLYKELKRDKSNSSIIVPVVVHVIHNNGIGNISKAQIEDGLDILNRDLQKMNADTSQVRAMFQPFIADLDIEFRLARIDPNGHCTEGITRTNSKLSNSAIPRNSVKPLSRWPYQNYFNVWLVNSIDDGTNPGTVLGYAQFPDDGFNPLNTYGVVVRHDEWGTIGTAQGSDGRTATHEVGHCLNLLHSFEGGCGTTCENSGDHVCDTPPTATSTFGCNTNNNSCSNDASGFSPYTSNVSDMLENFMSYDDCQYMFTEGQKIRVLATLNGNIPELMDLFTQTNLVATGTDSNYVAQVCSPIAEIISEPLHRCVGANIIFEEHSYNADIIGWNWSFPGGTPSSSTDSMPIVNYSTPGIYSYTLIVSSASGSDTIVLDSTITIADTVASYPAFAYIESFENQNVPNDWSIINEGGLSEWLMDSSRGFTGTRSFWIMNMLESSIGEKDALISPSYDLSTVINPKMKFNVAYRKKNGQSAEILKIYSSLDCGNTWNTMYTLHPGDLQDTIDYPSWFIPQSSNDWKEISITLPSWIKNQRNIKFKFELTAGGGNNFFFDYLRFEGASSSTGISEVEDQIGIDIFPNPSSNDFHLVLELNESSDVQITMQNLLGKTIKVISKGNFAPNTYSYHIGTDDLPSGIYLIKLEVGEKLISRKLVLY